VPRANEQLARRGFEAFKRGDVEANAELLDEMVGYATVDAALAAAGVTRAA